jgi:peptidoglycan/LPS O-acetylase OafA/YrhL
MILKYRLPIITLILLVLLLIMQVLAIEYYWYVAFPPLDLFMHFLGGVCIALSVLYVLKKPKHIILFTILGGIAWEVIEVYGDISGYHFGTYEYYFDTIKDIVVDTLGGVLVYFINKDKNK